MRQVLIYESRCLALRRKVLWEHVLLASWDTNALGCDWSEILSGCSRVTSGVASISRFSAYALAGIACLCVHRASLFVSNPWASEAQRNKRFLRRWMETDVQRTEPSSAPFSAYCSAAPRGRRRTTKHGCVYERGMPAHKFVESFDELARRVPLRVLKIPEQQVTWVLPGASTTKPVRARAGGSRT